MATIDYMIASYGPYAASATGGNGFARDFLAGVAAMYSIPSKLPTMLISKPCFFIALELCLTRNSVSKHGNNPQIGMAIYILGIHGYYLHDPHICFLFLWT